MLSSGGMPSTGPPSRHRAKFARSDTPVARARPPVLQPAVPGLRGLLRGIDGVAFQAYRRILGDHEIGEFRLAVQSVPPDALGGPARMRLSIDRKRAGLEGDWSRGDLARLVLEDAIVRAAEKAIGELTGAATGAAPGSGRIFVDPPGPGTIERTSARVADDSIDIALACELPASDRRARGQQAETIFFDLLPRIGMAALLFPLRRAEEQKRRIAELALRRAIASALPGRGLAAFVPAPLLAESDVPPGTWTTIDTPLGSLSGLAIPVGVTLFAASGVAGAGLRLSEWGLNLDALENRGAILAGPVATIRPLRRPFGPIDLTAFVAACPEVPKPGAYAGDGTCAPLSLAAALVEAIETGASVIVMDEDELPAGAIGAAVPAIDRKADETPLTSVAARLHELSDRWGLSFFVAARSGSSLFDAADTVFHLRGERLTDDGGPRSARRKPRQAALRPDARSLRIVTDIAPAALKVAAWGGRGLRVGDDLIDLTDAHPACEPAQLRALAALLKLAARQAASWRPVADLLNELDASCGRVALDGLEEPGLTDLARPSRVAIAGALARWKRVEFRTAAGTLRRKAEDLP